MDNDDIKSTLKSYFQSGDVPTEGQFAELIDASLNPDIARFSEGMVAINRLPKQLDLTQHVDNSEAVITATKLIGEGSEITNLNINAFNGIVPIEKLPVADVTDIANANNNVLVNAAQAKKITHRIETLSCPKPLTMVQYISTENINYLSNPGIIDGFNLQNGDLVLLLAQTETKTNRIYQYNTDQGLVIPFNFGDESLLEGTRVAAERGQNNANTIYLLTEKINDQQNQLQQLYWCQVVNDHIIGDGLIEQANRFHIDFAMEIDIANQSINKAVDAALLSTLLDQQQLFSAQQIQQLDRKAQILSCPQAITTVQYIAKNEIIDLSNPGMVDGYDLQQDDLVLLLGQTDPKANRVYSFQSDQGLVISPSFNDELLMEGLRITAVQGNTQVHTLHMLVAKRYDSHNQLAALEWCPVFGDYFAGDGISIDGLTINMNIIPQEKLPQASITEKGAVILATDTDINEGIDSLKAITPQALKQANLLNHLFEFVEDTGQSEAELVIPEGKILALYKEAP